MLQHLPLHGALDTEIFIARASQAVGDTSVTRYAHNHNCSIFLLLANQSCYTYIYSIDLHVYVLP